MQGVVELYCHREVAIQNPRHSIPEDPNQPNAEEVTIPLWYQDNGLLFVFLRKVTLT